MIMNVKLACRIGAALGLAGALCLPVLGQNAAPNPAKKAVDARKAAFTLIGANYQPLGAVLKGEKPYDAADAQKRITRLAVLAEILNDAFPDGSNVGLPDSKAKADIWNNHEDFLKKVKGLQDNLANLQKVNAAEKSGSEAYKTALNAVAQDCKSCHDAYKEK